MMQCSKALLYDGGPGTYLQSHGDAAWQGWNEPADSARRGFGSAALRSRLMPFVRLPPAYRPPPASPSPQWQSEKNWKRPPETLTGCLQRHTARLGGGRPGLRNWKLRDDWQRPCKRLPVSSRPAGPC